MALRVFRGAAVVVPFMGQAGRVEGMEDTGDWQVQLEDGTFVTVGEDYIVPLTHVYPATWALPGQQLHGQAMADDMPPPTITTEKPVLYYGGLPKDSEVLLVAVKVETHEPMAGMAPLAPRGQATSLLRLPPHALLMTVQKE